MGTPDIKKIKSFFETYYHSFKGLDENQEKNFLIKKEHSYRVATLMESFASWMGMAEEFIALSYITGLLHDLGRFPQFIEYSTFNDDVSADHAALSAEVINNEGLNSLLEGESFEMVSSAIFLHNKYEVSKNLPQQTVTLAKLLRDADKLDILEVICTYYENRDREPNHTLTWEMPDSYKISDEVARAIGTKKQIPKAIIKNKLDIKVYQMSWIYDLNYKPAFCILASKRYIERIYDTLPKSEKIIEFYRGIKIYIENQVNS